MLGNGHRRRIEQQKNNDILSSIKNSSVMIASWRFLEETKELQFNHVSQNIGHFGYTSQELLLGEVSWVVLIHPEDRLGFYERLSDAVQCDWNNYTNCFRLKNKAGEYRWVKETTTIMRYEDNSIDCFHSVFVDITEHKALESQLDQRHIYFEALHETTLAITNRLDINELTTSFAARLTEIFKCENIVILLVNQETDTLAPFATTGKYASDKRTGVKRGEGAVGEVWETAQPLYLEDYSQYTNPIKNSVFTIKAFISIPLIVSNKVIGVMGLGFSVPQTFSDFTKEYLEKYSQLVAIALDNAQLHSQVKNDLRRNEALLEISRSVQESNCLDTLLGEIVKQIHHAIDTRCVAIYKVDFENSYIERVSKTPCDDSGDSSDDTTLPTLSFEQLMDDLTGLAIRTQQVIVRKKEAQDLININTGLPQVLNEGSTIVLPLKYEGNVLGIIQLVNSAEDTDFAEKDVALLTAISVQISVALAQFDLKKKLEHQAYHDALTGLANRVLFDEALNTTLSIMQQKNGMFAIIFLDLDGFKHVNDTLGHDVGDTLLQLVTERLKLRVRKTDTLARMGGDEFAIVVNDIASKEEAYRIAESCLSLFEDTFQIDTYKIPISASIGISCYPDDAHDATSLLKHADSAMYQAKYSGKNGVCIFTPELVPKSKERLDFEVEIVLN